MRPLAWCSRPRSSTASLEGALGYVVTLSTRLAAASAFVTALVVGAVWLTDLSFQRAILLAPVLVIGIGAVAGLLVFWGRIGWDSVRRNRHPRLIVAGAVAFLALLTVLTLLGVNLPHE